MQTLWTVMRLEWALLRRGRVIWVMTLVMALLGVWEASGIRGLPWGIWSNFVVTSTFLVTLILAFATGDQIQRDQERRLAGVILSMPISTAAYVWGKYLSALAALLALTLVSLLAALLADQWYPATLSLPIFGLAKFPPLGWQAYLIFWCWFAVVPTLFGAALTLAAITLTNGQRIIAYILALLFWVPSVLGGLPSLLDITAGSFFLHQESPHLSAVFLLATATDASGSLPAANAQRVMDLLRLDIPPTFLPLTFLWNRLFFLGLSLLLVWATVVVMDRRRRGVAPVIHLFPAWLKSGKRPAARIAVKEISR